MIAASVTHDTQKKESPAEAGLSLDIDESFLIVRCQ